MNLRASLASLSIAFSISIVEGIPANGTNSATLEDLTRYVNPFIGTQGPIAGSSYNGGNIFPGPTRPFGAVKPGIDTTEYNPSADANGGYTPDGNVTAITMLHESGTGGSPKYGIIPQMPLTTIEGVNLLDNLTYMQPRLGNDTASVGYYKTSLANGIDVKLAASQHTGLFQYTFPKDGDKYILVDLSHYLPTQDEPVAEQFYSNAMLDVVGNGTMYSGYGVYRGGWNEAPDYTVYFCAQYDVEPSEARLFRGPYTDPYWPNNTNVSPAEFVDGTSIIGGTPGWGYADRVGALFKFPGNATKVSSKIGVSWISVDKACSFLDEIPSYDLKSAVDATVTVWNDEVLNKIRVESTANATRLEMFYTALYHTHLLPSNRTGENPYWEPSKGIYYDDFYTLWDTFRCLNSLLGLISPEVEIGIVNTLIDIWKHERFMPDGRSSNYNGRVQGGSNADNVLADAYVKNLGEGRINWTEGYMAMATDAEVVPYNNFDPEDLTGSTKEGRGALPDWLRYGYVTPNFGRSISKTVEYSLNDFAVSQVAKVESPNDYAKYLNRSAGWQRTWRNVTSLNYTGFLAPVYANGSHQTYDPLSCGECEWSAIAYEALPWEYSFTIPFDMSSLIRLMGGNSRTESRLDTMFIPGLKQGSVGGGGNNGIGTTIFNPGNEPSFATPFLYSYLPGRQFKSVQRGREVVNQYYTTNENGLPGNSDAGAIDSWLVWNMLGLYPVVTQPVYLLLSPWFEDITVDVGDGKKLRITAKGLGDDAYYVQSVKVNGKKWTKSWVSHKDLIEGNGGRIEFILGEKKASWDTGKVPPSPGHVKL